MGRWIRDLQGRYIIVGDFNLPDIHWQTGSTGRKGEILYEAACDYFLEQHVEWETHDGGSTLDLLFSNTEGMVDNVFVDGKIGKSDHDIIAFSVNIDQTRAESKRNLRITVVPIGTKCASKCVLTGMLSWRE